MSKFTTARTKFFHGWRLFRSRKTLWQMIREVFNGHYRMSFFTNALTILAIAYIVFPFDLVPDYIPVLGWIDDGAVLYLLILRLEKETHRYNRFKAMERKNG